MSSVIYGLKPTMSVVAQKYMSVSSMASRDAKPLVQSAPIQSLWKKLSNNIGKGLVCCICNIVAVNIVVPDRTGRGTGVCSYNLVSSSRSFSRVALIDWRY